MTATSTTEGNGRSAEAVPLELGDAILELLNGFITELRAAGLPVSLTENLDALEAVKHVPIGDRESFKFAPGRHVGEALQPLESL